ncbi:MAG: hypothetical protein ACJA1C_002377 [Crocinitomicaceae bacterium]|jgi:hypothetical protein
MKIIYCFLFISLPPYVSSSQQLSLVTPLAVSLQESSGLIALNGKLITHNDSGGEPKLFELDSTTGNFTRSVFIQNASNTDWEDICIDANYIYIADIGNNSGTRTDLKIYRVSIAEYLSTPNDTVIADTINFSYSEQVDFTPSTFSTNYDAEALIAFNDSLYIFTKNWGDNWTNVYALPKNPGTYSLLKGDSINSQGLVTGAIYNDLENKIHLSGYTFTTPFIVEISGFGSSPFSSGIIDRYAIVPPSGSSIQIESITNMQNNQYYLTAEESQSGSAALYRLNEDFLKLDENLEVKVGFYPNPASDFIEIKCDDFSQAEFYGLNGAMYKVVNHKTINVSELSAGTYWLVVKDSNGKKVLSEKLVLE